MNLRRQAVGGRPRPLGQQHSDLILRKVHSSHCAMFSDSIDLRNAHCSHKHFAECALFSTCALSSQAVCGMCIVLSMCIAECAMFSQTVCGMCIVLNMRIVLTSSLRNVHCSLHVHCGMRIVLTNSLRNVHCSQHAHCSHCAECALFSRAVGVRPHPLGQHHLCIVLIVAARAEHTFIFVLKCHQ